MKMKKEFCLLVINILLFLVLCSIFYFSITNILSEGLSPQKGNDLYDQKFYKLDLERNISSFGFVTTSRKLGEDDQEFIKDEEGKYVALVTSSFENDIYECKGTCYCTKRRSIGSRSVMSRSLTFLVAAFSSTIAYQKSMEYFEKECARLMSGSDDDEIEECHDLFADFEICSDSIGWEGRYKPKTKDSGEKRKFHCKAHCLARTWFEREDYLQAARDFQCEKLVLDKVFKFDCKGMKQQTMIIEKVRRIFQEEYLTDFCHKNSLTKYFDEVPPEFGVWVKIRACQSAPPRTLSGSLTLNPSIFCHQIEPEYTGHSWPE